jgi:hypothetical protein
MLLFVIRRLTVPHDGGNDGSFVKRHLASEHESFAGMLPRQFADAKSQLTITIDKFGSHPTAQATMKGAIPLADSILPS